MEKDKSKRKGNENPKSGELTELRGNCRKWGHNVLSLLARNRFNEFEAVRRFGGHRCRHKKELGLLEFGSENAEKSWLGMVVGFAAIKQFSVDSVASVHVCPKSCATHATLFKVSGMREVVSNEINLHGPFDSL